MQQILTILVVVLGHVTAALVLVPAVGAECFRGNVVVGDEVAIGYLDLTQHLIGITRAEIPDLASAVGGVMATTASRLTLLNSRRRDKTNPASVSSRTSSTA